MIKITKYRLLITFTLIIVFVLTSIPATVVEGQGGAFSEVQNKLAIISQEEREILSNLFLIVQEIEEMEREEEKLFLEIETINQEIHQLEKVMVVEETAYRKKQEDLKQVLKSYQRMGPGSYLEILLDADSLATFLRRINILRDLTRNTGNLLEAMDEGREKLVAEKTKLAEKLDMMEEKQRQLQEALAKNLQLRNDIEEYLASMEEEREYYQEHLDSIQKVWQQLKPLLSATVGEFSRIIREESFPPDALKLSFSFLSVKGTLEEKTLNTLIAQHTTLPEMNFRFSPNRVEMELPELNLVLAGTFAVEDSHTLKFHVTEGNFYQMPLEAGAIEDLFSENELVLNLRSVLEGNSLRSVSIQDGYIELISTFSLF